MFCGLADPFGIALFCSFAMLEGEDSSITLPFRCVQDQYFLCSHRDEGVAFMSVAYEKDAIEGNLKLEKTYELGCGLS